MKLFHISLAVKNIAESITDYSIRLGKNPDVIIDNEYALWRTEQLNFSIRLDPKNIGTLRHVGWEDSDAKTFSKQTDCNGIVWEHFSQKLQVSEIEDTWPDSIK